jgi:hypothetical protein
VVEDLGITGGLVLEEVWVGTDRDFDCFNHFIYAQDINR